MRGSCYLKRMHSPGICGVILAAGSQVGAGTPPSKSMAEAVCELIAALNSDTEMVLVALGAEAESLSPAVWERAAYVVPLPPDSSDADALRVTLQEVLNRGRDAALVTSLGDQALTAETVHATLNYVLNSKNPWFSHEQLDVKTPYNTYLKRGSPPTPICNPGYASLEAVAQPSQVPYLYYVAQGDGSHLSR